MQLQELKLCVELTLDKNIFGRGGRAGAGVYNFPMCFFQDLDGYIRSILGEKHLEYSTLLPLSIIYRYLITSVTY